MTDILYTDTDRIRGALMLGAEDLPDNRFHVEMLEEALAADLDEWLPTHGAIAYLGATAEQRSVAAALRIYSTYWLALQCAQLAPLAIPSDVADGKNAIKRDPKAEAALERVQGHLLAARRKLEKEVNGVTLSTGSQLVRDTPAYDPVTG